jgi:Domain of unknown function (DUF4326)
MSAPIRVQLSRKKGWRLPPNTVKVDRSTRWGNHWQVWKDDGQWYATRNASEHHPVPDQEAGISMAVAEHAKELRRKISKYGTATYLLELRGKNLACWCALDKPCHADVLLELANK